MSGLSRLSLPPAVSLKKLSLGYCAWLTGLLDMKFVLLHEGKNDDGIKSFFVDVWELYVKVGSGFSCVGMGTECYLDNVESVSYCT